MSGWVGVVVPGALRGAGAGMLAALQLAWDAATHHPLEAVARALHRLVHPVGRIAKGATAHTRQVDCDAPLTVVRKHGAHQQRRLVRRLERQAREWLRLSKTGRGGVV